MTIPRNQLINVADTPYYHCISRCVRQAFLCGKDKHSGQSFEHRRGWIEDKLEELSSIFSIDICAYSIMHNHTHIIFFIDKDTATAWSDAEVIHRWHQLFSGTLLTQQYSRGEPIATYLQQSLDETIACYRQRLIDISWFMRILNEGIARQANQEEGRKGRFWEGRFKSQALLDEAALAACMAYVDLNPIRANIATTPETSAFTSIQQRINAAKAAEQVKALIESKQPKQLLPFAGNPRKNMPKGLPFDLKDYIALVDLTGRCIREDKVGYINPNELPILERLNINEESWLSLTKNFTRIFHGAIGNPQTITDYYHGKENTKRRPNLSPSKKLFA